MNKDDIWIEQARSMKYFFYLQIWHLLIISILAILTWFLASPELGIGTWLGIIDITWFWLAVTFAVLHQIIAWLVFRLQLGWAFLTKICGNMDMLLWGIIFFPFLVSRPLLVLGLARASEDSLNFHPVFSNILAVILLIPAIYTLWSVLKYFGFFRALGGDHFRVQYRNMPLVKEGAFKYTSNAMYKFAFFLLWSIALFYNSRPALLVAIFQHLSIWVHYYCTEKPDMELIYNTSCF